MKIHDAFIFAGFDYELDLLELRLQTLRERVDKFIIVEAGQTFQGTVKLGGLKLASVMRMYDVEGMWADRAGVADLFHNGRIVYVEVPYYPRVAGTWNPWEAETWSREALLLGVNRVAKPEDYVMLSDLDEIPNLAAWEKRRIEAHAYLFDQIHHYYYMNYRTVNTYKWDGTIMIQKHRLDILGSMQKLRNFRRELGQQRIDNGGWHYSCMGGAAAVAAKLKSFAHSEYNTEHFTDTERIEKCIEAGGDLLERDWLHTFKAVPVDDTFPQYLVKNQERFSKHLAKVM